LAHVRKGPAACSLLLSAFSNALAERHPKTLKGDRNGLGQCSGEHGARPWTQSSEGYCSGEGLEHLDPMAGAVGDEDGAVGANGDTLDVVELPGAGALAALLRQEDTRAGEALDAVIAGIGDIDRPIRGNGDALRWIELPVIITGDAPRVLEDTAGGEALDATVARINNVDVAVGRDGDVLKAVELAVAVAEAASQSDLVTVRLEALHTVIAAVADVDSAVERGNRDAGGEIERARYGDGRAHPRQAFSTRRLIDMVASGHYPGEEHGALCLGGGGRSEKGSDVDWGNRSYSVAQTH
jgi:hypothetical protein